MSQARVSGLINSCVDMTSLVDHSLSAISTRLRDSERLTRLWQIASDHKLTVDGALGSLRGATRQQRSHTSASMSPQLRYVFSRLADQASKLLIVVNSFVEAELNTCSHVRSFTHGGFVVPYDFLTVARSDNPKVPTRESLMYVYRTLMKGCWNQLLEALEGSTDESDDDDAPSNPIIPFSDAVSRTRAAYDVYLSLDRLVSRGDESLTAMRSMKSDLSSDVTRIRSLSDLLRDASRTSSEKRDLAALGLRVRTVLKDIMQTMKSREMYVAGEVLKLRLGLRDPTFPDVGPHTTARVTALTARFAELGTEKAFDGNLVRDWEERVSGLREEIDAWETKLEDAAADT
jgi:hypothetical protein